jgi:hypothetical protein
MKSGMAKALVILGAVNSFACLLCTSCFDLSENFFVKDRHLLLLRNCVTFMKICAAKASLMVVNGILFTAKLCHFDSKVHLGQICALYLRRLQSRVDDMPVSIVDFYLWFLHNSLTWLIMFTRRTKRHPPLPVQILKCTSRRPPGSPVLSHGPCIWWYWNFRRFRRLYRLLRTVGWRSPDGGDTLLSSGSVFVL